MFKATALKLTFAGRLSYAKKTGFRTPDLSPIFQLIQDLRDNDGEDFNPDSWLAEREGFEPPGP